MNIYKIKIGDVITPQMGWKLCKHFKFEYLAQRIEENPQKYKDFTFDGASMLNDKLVCFLLNIFQPHFTHLCALPHDLQYAYGEMGNHEEKKRADTLFRKNLIIVCNIPKPIANIFYFAVKYFSGRTCSFSWGFGLKERYPSMNL